MGVEIKMYRRKRTNGDEEGEEKGEYGKYLQCTIHICVKMPLLNSVSGTMNVYSEKLCVLRLSPGHSLSGSSFTLSRYGSNVYLASGFPYMNVCPHGCTQNSDTHLCPEASSSSGTVNLN